MTTRTNLSPNPSLRNNATGWFGPAGWARRTGSDASLPHSTSFSGTTAGDVVSPKWDVVASLQYVVSVSVYFVAASIGTISVDWYTSAGTYLSSSATVGFSQGAGTTARLTTAAVTAPTGATKGLLVVSGLDGEAQVTGLLPEQTGTTGGAYFDGDSSNSTWSGTVGNSTSIQTTAVTVSGIGLLGPLVGTATGVRTSFGTGAGLLGPLIGATGLLPSVTYDDGRGRIRIACAGFSAPVIRAEVYSRPVGAIRWALVRGGKVAVSGQHLGRTVDDYEFVAGGGMDYKIVGLSSAENQPPVIVQSVVVTLDDTLDQAWIKFIAAPYSNRKVTLTDWSEIERTARNAVYPVPGRRDPVVVTDLHGSRTVTVTLRTDTVEETNALDAALGQGAPVFFQTPTSVALPSLYAAVGTYSWRRPSKRAQSALFTVALTEVAAPPPSVIGAGSTWQTLLDRFASWQDVLDEYATWAEVAA